MNPGQFAFTAFVESIGIVAEWSDLTVERQAIWDFATDEWIRKNIRSSSFYTLLQSEMEGLTKGIYSTLPVSPLRLSREWLVDQANQLMFRLHAAEQEVKRLKPFEESHNDDDSEPFDEKFLRSKIWPSTAVKLPTGHSIEFDQFDNQWWAFMIDGRAEWHERRKLCTVTTRGDFRRLMKCLGVTLEEPEYYEMD